MFNPDSGIPTIDNPPAEFPRSGLLHAVDRAIDLVTGGQPIPFDLTAELAEVGLSADVIRNTFGN